MIQGCSSSRSQCGGDPRPGGGGASNLGVDPVEEQAILVSFPPGWGLGGCFKAKNVFFFFLGRFIVSKVMTHRKSMYLYQTKGSPPEIHAAGIWALPVRGGLNPCPDGLGHFFREEFFKFKWAFA